MNRLRRRLPAAAAVTFALLIVAAMVAPLASALESTDDTTLVDDTTSDDPTLDDASPSPTDDGTLESTVDDTTGTVDETVDTVEDTAEETSEELEASTEEVLAPEEGSSEEPTEEPSDEPSDEPNDEPAGDDTSSQESDTDDGDEASGQEGTREADRPSDEAEEGDERSGAAAVLARYREALSQRMIDAMYGAPYGDGSDVPVPHTDRIDPGAVFPAGPDRSGPVFAGLDYDRSHGQRSTYDILERLMVLGADFSTAADVLSPFPVVGPATYTDDWHYPRDGGDRLHKGTDIFAQRGTPIVASADGVIGRIGVNRGLGGNTIGLYADDGTYYYYAHLDKFAADVRFNLRVEQGDIIGFVGDSGNAAGTPPHLHFQIHPDNGAAVPPVEHLDGWLEEARAELQLLEGTSPIDLDQVERLELESVSNLDSSANVRTAPSFESFDGLAEQRATQLTGYEGQEHGPLGVAVFAALTALAWYLMRRRSAFAGAGASSSSQPDVAPDVLAPVLTVEDVVSAGQTSHEPVGAEDVLAPVLAGKGAETEDPADRDVLADVLS